MIMINSYLFLLISPFYRHSRWLSSNRASTFAWTIPSSSSIPRFLLRLLFLNLLGTSSSPIHNPNEQQSRLQPLHTLDISFTSADRQEDTTGRVPAKYDVFWTYFTHYPILSFRNFACGSWKGRYDHVHFLHIMEKDLLRGRLFCSIQREWRNGFECSSQPYCSTSTRLLWKMKRRLAWRSVCLYLYPLRRCFISAIVPSPLLWRKPTWVVN